MTGIKFLRFPLGIFCELRAAGWSSLPYLDRIPHQTLVICGDDDPLVPIGNAALLADRIPNAQLEIIEEAGHLFLWDDAENLGRRIGRFIDGSGPKVVTH